jgi:hypothetical protein
MPSAIPGWWRWRSDYTGKSRRRAHVAAGDLGRAGGPRLPKRERPSLRCGVHQVDAELSALTALPYLFVEKPLGNAAGPPMWTYRPTASFGVTSLPLGRACVAARAARAAAIDAGDGRKICASFATRLGLRDAGDAAMYYDRSAERHLIADLIARIGASTDHIAHIGLTGFWAAVGKDYRGEWTGSRCRRAPVQPGIASADASSDAPVSQKPQV